MGVNKVLYGQCESSEKVDTTHIGDKEDKIIALLYHSLRKIIMLLFNVIVIVLDRRCLQLSATRSRTCICSTKDKLRQ